MRLLLDQNEGLPDFYTVLTASFPPPPHLKQRKGSDSLKFVFAEVCASLLAEATVREESPSAKAPASAKAAAGKSGDTLRSRSETLHDE